MFRRFVFEFSGASCFGLRFRVLRFRHYPIHALIQFITQRHFVWLQHGQETKTKEMADVTENSGISNFRKQGQAQSVFLNFRKNFPELFPFHSISDRKSRKFWLNRKRPHSCGRVDRHPPIKLVLRLEVLLAYCKIRTRLDWIGLDWTGLDWIGLDWTGLDGTGLDWTGLDSICKTWICKRWICK